MLISAEAHRGTRRPAIAAAFMAAVLAAVVATPSAYGQTVNSGSDDSDGALTVASNLGTIIFDPADAARWGKVLDADGDGVYNFTSISIASGTTLKLTNDRVARPVYWLASGTVSIAGVLDLSGTSGSITSDPGFRRLVPVAGSGGFSGGAGGIRNVCSTNQATAGEGPGGGAQAGPCDGNYRSGSGGAFFGNRYVVPLIGGSGGGGALDDAYVSGGAGGGAILIASSSSIAVTGRIESSGGGAVNYNRCGGGGSGGSIRLVAPAITGSGALNVNGGSSCSGGTAGAAGQVRLEAFNISSSLTFNAGGFFVTRGSPVDESSLRPSGQVRVTSIGGVAVPPNPAGSFVLPDVTISAGAAVPVVIDATGVPPGTVVTLHVYPQSPSDLSTVYLPPVTTTLSGTLAASTATIDFVFPYGFSRGTIIASWIQ